MENLQKIIEKLPQNIQDILYSDEYFAKFKSISDKFELNIEESGILMEELVYVIAGLTHPDDFAGDIQKELSLSREKAAEITAEVDREVLKSIRADLIKIYNGEPQLELQDATSALPLTGQGRVENPKSQSQNSKTTTDEVEENMDRDSLLNEIENPRSAQNSSMTEVSQNTDLNSDEIHNTPQEDLIGEMENPAPTPARGDVVGSKLKDRITVPKKQIKNDESASSWKQPIDPYREPIG